MSIESANQETSKREVSEFTKGEALVWVAYLSSDGKRVTTWMGETLATITSMGKPYRSNLGSVCTPFRAKGIDGREHYGRHNGPGMHLRLRAAK